MSLRKAIPILAISLPILLTDQIAKIWAVKNLVLHEELTFSWPSSYIRLGLVHSHCYAGPYGTGEAFFGEHANLCMGWIRILVLAGVAWLYLRGVSTCRARTAMLALAAAGTCGALLDRLLFGYEINPFLIKIPSWNDRFPNLSSTAFMLGDTCIGISLILAVWCSHQMAARRAKALVTARGPSR